MGPGYVVVRCIPETAQGLDIEVHTELQRMWPHSQRLNLFLPFVRNPAVNQPGGENIALQQELVVRLESIKGLIERAR